MVGIKLTIVAFVFNNKAMRKVHLLSKVTLVKEFAKAKATAQKRHGLLALSYDVREVFRKKNENQLNS